MSTEKAGRHQAGQFRKGISGNPNGRPKGARNSATLAAEALLDGEAEALTRKAVQMALEGDTVALRLCIERPVTFALPPITSARDAADISAAGIDAVSNGAINLGEAAEIAKLIDAYVRAYKTAELDDRVAPAERLTTTELHRIAAGHYAEPERRASKLLLLNSR